MIDKRFNKCIQEFSFLQIQNDCKFDCQILEIVNEPKIIIDIYINIDKEYVFACFNKQFIIFDKCNHAISDIRYYFLMFKARYK